MVKVRMNTADVAAEVRCLRKLIGMRCANVYDISPKTYVIKLAKSSGLTTSGEGERALILLESGVRFHMTEFSRDKSVTPSGFTLKLRKHIRTRRLENVQQLGIDRVVDFQFGVGDLAHHIILELYAQGNLLLTDADYNVLTLLRSHRDDNKGIAMMARHRYPIEICRKFQRTTLEKLTSVVASVEKESNHQIEGNKSNGEKQAVGPKEDLDVSTKKGGQGKDEGTLKMVLGENFGYGPALCEHMILDAGLQPSTKVSDASNKLTLTQDEIKAMLASIERFEDWLEKVISAEVIPEGYIFFQKKGPKKKAALSTESEGEKMYDEFCPLLLNQFSHREHMKLETFDAALDEFFSKIEGQRLDQQRKTQEESAVSRLEKIRADQKNRVEALRREADQAVYMAELIEYNLTDVDLAIEAVRAALAGGMDWKDLGRMIKEERKAGNPVAGLIHSLQLEKNQITLLLSNNLDDMDDDEKTKPAAKVEVDLALSAYANARRWFDTKKKQAYKQEKTVAAHEKAFKAAEKKTQQQLAQAKTVASIWHLRKVHWFEKFNWFISSENYLIISGRDAQQNEQIVKRYMKKGDLYVHADLHGASSTIIKNHDPAKPVPPLTINQAGCFTVCRSQAWDSKIITSAWWVYDHQVSKTAPTGEYLTVGSFMVRGKKNFLPPYPLVMGFGLLFRLDESSIPAHFNERRVRAEGEINNDEASREEDDDNHDANSEKRVWVEGEINNKEASTEKDDDEDDSKEEDEGPESEIDEDDSAGMAADDKKERGAFEGSAGPQENNKNEILHPEENAGSDNSELDNLLDEALGLKTVLTSQTSSRKYELQQEQQPERVLSVEEVERDNKTSREKPYISKAERRRRKKGGTNDQEATPSEQDDVGNVRASASKLDNKPSEKAGTKAVRGKKGELKKIKKYAEQDEEERELRMSLLSSAGRKEVQKDTKAPSKGENDKKSEGNRLVICYKCKKPGHVAAECPDSMAGSRLAETAESEIAMIMAEENIVDLDEEDKEKLTELDSLTGNPLPEDVLLYAVPVCGPYNALQSYKYHVKLTPGPSKKGKGAKTAMSAFPHLPGVSPREKELMKAVAEPDLVACMIGNVKVSAPGLAKLKQTQKKSKKKQTGKKD